MGETEETSLRVTGEVKQRFDTAKPYDSLSADEFIDTLLDRWEGQP
jgi:hypothetical protein